MKEEAEVEGKKARGGGKGGEGGKEDRGEVERGGGKFTFDFKGDVPRGRCFFLDM